MSSVFLFYPPFLFFPFYSFDLFFTSFLTIETFITFSHDFKYLPKKKKIWDAPEEVQRMKRRGYANSWPCLLYSETVVTPRGVMLKTCTCTKRITSALMGIIKKLPISGNRLAFCRLPGLAKKKYGFSLDRLKSLATSFHFLKLSNSSVHRS